MTMRFSSDKLGAAYPLAVDEVVQARAALIAPDATAGRLLLRINEQCEREVARFWFRDPIEFEQELDRLRNDRMEQIKTALMDLATENVPAIDSYDEIERSLVYWHDGVAQDTHLPFESPGMTLSSRFISAFNNAWRLVCEK